MNFKNFVKLVCKTSLIFCLYLILIMINFFLIVNYQDFLLAIFLDPIQQWIYNILFDYINIISSINNNFKTFTVDNCVFIAAPLESTQHLSQTYSDAAKTAAYDLASRINFNNTSANSLGEIIFYCGVGVVLTAFLFSGLHLNKVAPEVVTEVSTVSTKIVNDVQIVANDPKPFFNLLKSDLLEGYENYKYLTVSTLDAMLNSTLNGLHRTKELVLYKPLEWFDKGVEKLAYWFNGGYPRPCTYRRFRHGFDTYESYYQPEVYLRQQHSPRAWVEYIMDCIFYPVQKLVTILRP